MYLFTAHSIQITFSVFHRIRNTKVKVVKNAWGRSTTLTLQESESSTLTQLKAPVWVPRAAAAVVHCRWISETVSKSTRRVTARAADMWGIGCGDSEEQILQQQQQHQMTDNDNKQQATFSLSAGLISILHPSVLYPHTAAWLADICEPTQARGPHTHTHTFSPAIWHTHTQQPRLMAVDEWY